MYTGLCFVCVSSREHQIVKSSFIVPFSNSTGRMLQTENLTENTKELPTGIYTGETTLLDWRICRLCSFLLSPCDSQALLFFFIHANYS